MLKNFKDLAALGTLAVALTLSSTMSSLAEDSITQNKDGLQCAYLRYESIEICVGQIISFNYSGGR
jgi:hypothetical protein